MLSSLKRFKIVQVLGRGTPEETIPHACPRNTDDAAGASSLWGNETNTGVSSTQQSQIDDDGLARRKTSP